MGDPPRRRPPIQQPIGRPRRPLTPAQRDAMRRQRLLAEARRRQQQEAVNPRGRPALPIRRRPTVEQLRNARNFMKATRRRRPVGDPKPRTRVAQARQAPRTIRKPQRPV